MPKFFLTGWLEAIEGNYSSETWSTIVIVFVWIGFGSIAAFLIIWSPLFKKGLFGLAVISFIIIIAGFIFAHNQHQAETSRNEAIIFAPNVYIKSSPDENGTKLFILHEGTRVKILDAVGEWKKIKIADGNIGWLPENSIEVI